jgi:hypothetical protein
MKRVEWLLLLLALILGFFVRDIVGQEKPVRPMRQWQLGWVRLPERNHEFEAKIDVFDTEGVCLYVASTQREDDRGFGDTSRLGLSQSVAITAVSKADLPVGTGCQ